MSLDITTLATLSHLESRLLRLEHLLYGHATSQASTSAITSLQQLERRFRTLLLHVSDYAALLRIYHQHPDIFHPPSSTSSAPPPDLPPSALAQIVLASAASYPATASALTSISDTPVPDPALSASLVALTPRMKVVEATQLAQAAEIAELRRRSEETIRCWYEKDVMGYSSFVAGIEGKIENAERTLKRVEKARQQV